MPIFTNNDVARERIKDVVKLPLNQKASVVSVVCGTHTSPIAKISIWNEVKTVVVEVGTDGINDDYIYYTYIKYNLLEA